MLKANLENIRIGLLNQIAREGFQSSVYDCLEYIMLNPADIPGYWHPLGFISITLKEWDKNDERIRIHIWSDSERRSNAGLSWIHNHEYNIRSYLICGKIFNARYLNTKDCTKEFNKFRVEYREENSDLIYTGEKCQLVEGSLEEWRKGAFYSLAKWEYHASQVDQGLLTSTIVLNSEKENATAFAVSEKNKIQLRYNYKREKCNPKTINILLKKILNTVSNHK